jgi:hypothetical protein
MLLTGLMGWEVMMRINGAGREETGQGLELI